jgi:hypothetical protein
MPFIQAGGAVDAHGRLKALVNYGKPKRMLAQPAKKGESSAGSGAPPDCVRGRHVLHVAEEVIVAAERSCVAGEDHVEAVFEVVVLVGTGSYQWGEGWRGVRPDPECLGVAGLENDGVVCWTTGPLTS